MIQIIIFNFLLFSFVFSANREINNNIIKSYHPNKINQKIVLDGVLDENQWEDAEVIVDFIQLEPNFNSIPSKDSEVKVIYSNSSIYFGVTLYDSLSNISFKNGEYDDFENIFYENSDYFIIEI